MNLRNVLTKVGRRLAPRVIFDRDGLNPYLSRYYLLFRDRGDEASRFPFNVFLHFFHRGDDDEALHNHPWKWSVSVILKGGYVEERRVGLRIIRKVLRPGRINIIRADDYHRVDLLQPKRGAWSLFIAGPRTGKSWGFWDRDTRVYTPWRTFIAQRRGVDERTIGR